MGITTFHLPFCLSIIVSWPDEQNITMPGSTISIVRQACRVCSQRRPSSSIIARPASIAAPRLVQRRNYVSESKPSQAQVADVESAIKTDGLLSMEHTSLNGDPSRRYPGCVNVS